MSHPAQLPLDVLLSECAIKQLRRGGPGGQHRNKVETAISIEHTPTGVRAEASERRSQADNRRVAIHRLRLTLAVEYRTHVATTSDNDAKVILSDPSALWQSRRANGRMNVASEHEDLPALLSELLDHLAACNFDMATASSHFGVSNSQLVNLLRSYPPALASVNAARVSLGAHKLR